MCLKIKDQRKSNVPPVLELSGEKHQKHLSQSKNLVQQSYKNKTYFKKWNFALFFNCQIYISVFTKFSLCLYTYTSVPVIQQKQDTILKS